MASWERTEGSVHPGPVGLLHTGGTGPNSSVLGDLMPRTQVWTLLYKPWGARKEIRKDCDMG